MADLSRLQKNLGVAFKDVSRLEQALVHGSYVNESPKPAQVSNERLEFLGDAVLGLVVAEKLYRDYPEMDEGEMTSTRAELVRKETLARAAASIELGSYLYLGKGEEAGGGRKKPANLASALEAVIAAVFLDSGLEAARTCILKLLDPDIRQAVSMGQTADYKSELQHLIQSRRQETPFYRLVEAVGPDHGKTFTVEAVLGELVLGRGSGKSKKAAEQEAAKAALETLEKGFTV